MSWSFSFIGGLDFVRKEEEYINCNCRRDFTLPGVINNMYMTTQLIICTGTPCDSDSHTQQKTKMQLIITRLSLNWSDDNTFRHRSTHTHTHETHHWWLCVFLRPGSTLTNTTIRSFLFRFCFESSANGITAVWSDILCDNNFRKTHASGQSSNCGTKKILSY